MRWCCIPTTAATWRSRATSATSTASSTGARSSSGQEIVNQRVAPAPLEVRSSACVWGQDGRLTFWGSTQQPHGARDSLAKSLKLEPSQVHFIAPDVGGGFGAKFGLSVEDVFLAVMSQAIGPAAALVETRTENMLGMGHGRAQLQTVTIGGRRDGTIEAYALEHHSGQRRVPEHGHDAAAHDTNHGDRRVRHSQTGSADSNRW